MMEDQDHVEELREAKIQMLKNRITKNSLFITLSDFPSEELDSFKTLIELEIILPSIPQSQLKALNTEQLVELMVRTYRQESLKLTEGVLGKMNRTDLAMKLSDFSPATKRNHQPTLTLEGVERLESVVELLSEILEGLSNRGLKRFRKVLIRHKSCSSIPLVVLEAADKWDVVLLLVQTFGEESVRKTEEVLNTMHKTELVQRLSKGCSGPKKIQSLDLHQFVLMHKVVTMRTVRELLLKTFSDLSYEELKNFRWLLQFTCFQKNLPHISWRQLQTAAGHHEDRMKQMVNLLMETYGQQCVEVIMLVFMNMNRSDLVQRLSDTCSASQAANSSSDPYDVEMMETDSEDKHWPEQNQKMDEMMSVAESLAKVLKHLDLRRFIEILQSQRDFYRCLSNIPLTVSEITELPDVLLLMVQSGCQQFVEMTKEILKKMEKTDLVPMLSVSSSEPKKEYLAADEHLLAVTQKVATMAAVRQLLLETLKALSHEEHKKFKVLLKSTVSSRNLPDISMVFGDISEEEKTVKQMMQTYGQQCLEIMREIFMNMKRPDLVQRLPVPSTTLKGKHFVEELQLVKLEKAAVKQILVETLSGLSFWDLEKFKWLLQFTCFQKSLPKIRRWELDRADRAELLVNLMTDTWDHQSLEVANEVLMDMNRTDLVQIVSEKGQRQMTKNSNQLSLQNICKKEDLQEDSRKWTLLKPEVESRDANESSIYSHQSEAGNFECSVSGLRWVCQEKVSFKYQFGSCEEPLKRMENIQYRPAGPLIDLTVSTGRFDEVYLPHWISIKNNPEILDKFAVLHIDDCGDAVENVTEVTTSHVKLPDPSFSLKMALIKWLGFSVEVKCKVLIYMKNTASLKLHVYLIPHDAGLQEKLDRKELSYGYDIMPKPHPNNNLRMKDQFLLTTDSEEAEICPEALLLEYDADPNFFEVFIENPNTRFSLSLFKVSSDQTVWTCPIRTDDYQTLGSTTGKDFVDEHRKDLIQRVSNIDPILDHLREEDVIQQEEYNTICALSTTQSKMRRLYSGALSSGGRQAKDVFYKILKKMETFLVADLARKQS